jgi:hypothetical protein
MQLIDDLDYNQSSMCQEIALAGGRQWIVQRTVE